MTNKFPGIGYTTLGRDFNYFEKLSISATTFGGSSVDGYQPDVVITFSTYGVILTNLTLPAASSKIIEYSFNGQTVHGELDATSGSQTISLKFENRVVSKIWFRVQSGSTGPIEVSVQAWSIR